MAYYVDYHVLFVFAFHRSNYAALVIIKCIHKHRNCKSSLNLHICYLPSQIGLGKNLIPCLQLILHNLQKGFLYEFTNFQIKHFLLFTPISFSPGFLTTTTTTILAPSLSLGWSSLDSLGLGLCLKPYHT